MGTRYISEVGQAGALVAEQGGRTTVAVAEGESVAVRRAVEDLARDLEKVCGCTAVVSHQRAGARLVVGTIGVSPMIDAAIASGELDVSTLHTDDGLRWEGFVIATVGDTLYIAGADRRGTIFGVYDVCEAIGVSPWWWFADAPVRRRERVVVDAGTHVTDWPSVQYRGIFINDEEELEDWARAHTSDTTIGPETYERIFELLLRLKANYIWPAMHVNAFNHDPDNGRLANDMGIVVGTSHCDMLLRSNEKEFAPWAAAQDAPVEYDYSIPGRNREMLLQYWRESVQQNRSYEVSWTLGMRGIHDYGFTTSVIDADEHMSEAQKHRARVALLGQAIADQRALLREQLGDAADDALQLFIPYKEVLPLYDSGLDVPEDVTVVWANDNFGYVRRFPDEAERSRSGGHGLYYHSSYWSQPPRSYLATSSTPLALMKNELRKSWEGGIRRLWVNNVGGIKPLEIETEFFLRCAWEAGKETTTADVVGFVEQWVDKTFSGGHGKRAAEAYAAYYQLNNQRKIEHLAAEAFAHDGYGNEAFGRLQALHELFVETNEILLALPESERDAFFQLIAVKIHLAYLVTGQFVHADRSTLAHERGALAAADRHLEISRTFDAHKRALLHFYDTTMSGGRWTHIFTPEQFPPPTMALYPAGRPALRIGPPGLGVVLPGDPPSRHELEFWPRGARTHWIELFTAGAPGVRFTATSDSWIDVVPASGTIDVETRVAVRLRDPDAHAGRTGTIAFSSPDDGTEVTVTVRVHRTPSVDAGFVGAFEADRYVSIDVAQPDSRRDGASSRWAIVPLLGRYGNNLLEARSDDGSPAGREPDGAWAAYQVLIATPGAHLLELHRLPTLDATGRIRVGVSIDDGPPVVVESPTTDEYRGCWTRAVLDNVERLYVRLPYLHAGSHTLRLHVIDPHVAVSKAVIYTGRRKETNLGPGFSHHARRPLIEEPNPASGSVDVAELADVARSVYRTEPQSVPLPPVVYAGRGFWDTDTTFKRNVTVAQTVLGEVRHQARADGTKDVLAELGRGVTVEHDGVLALEAEYALAQDAGAWTTPSLDRDVFRWTHTQAETDGGSGLAMHVGQRGRRWNDPVRAPGLHYALDVRRGGTYRVWMLVKFDSQEDDSCVLALDGTVQPSEQQFSGGDLYSFGTQQIWFWTLLSQLSIRPGRRTLSVLARKSGLRIDRLYLTTGEELPPVDACWRPSERR